MGIDIDGVIPIFPTNSFFYHKFIGHSTRLTIKRHQLPILGGYAFTDYKVQGKFLVFLNEGKTFSKCLIDGESDRMAPASPYVMLSRARGLNSVMLLSKFKLKHMSSNVSSEVEIHLNTISNKYV